MRLPRPGRARLPAFIAAVTMGSAALQAAHTVEFKSGTYEASELDFDTDIRLACSPPAGPEGLSVWIKVAEGSAQVGVDYRYAWRQTDEYEVNFPPGATEAGARLWQWVTPLDDGLSEPDETIQLAISRIPSGTLPGPLSKATLILHNARPRISFTGWYPSVSSDPPEFSEQWGVPENNGTALVVVERKGDTNQPVTVEYSLADLTARAGLDYVAQSGTLTFPAGQRSSSITVALLNNGRFDSERVFELVLSEPSPGSDLFIRRARLPILDDEVRIFWDRTFQVDGLADPFPRLVAVQPNGKVIVTDSSELFRVNRDGSRDPSFQSAIASEYISDVALDHQGRIYLCGSFEAINDVPRQGLARLNANGSLDPSFVASPSGSPEVLAVQSDDRLLVMGGGYLWRVGTDGSEDHQFTAPAIAFESRPTFASTAGDKILVIAADDHSTPGRWLLRLGANGQVDSSFHSPAFDQPPRGLAVAADGSILVYGSFSSVDGEPRDRLARLNADGTVDLAFHPAAIGGGELRAAFAPDGRVVVSRVFGLRFGGRQGALARLLSDGSLDAGFGPIDFGPMIRQFGDNAWVGELQWAFEPNGDILAGGDVYVTWREDTWWRGRFLSRLYGAAPTNSFEFVESRYEAGEGSESVRIAVRRIGDTSGSASVQYRTRDATAFAGLDYQAQTGTLTFAPLDTEQSFVVSLRKSSSAVPDRTVVLELSDGVGVALIGLPTAELHLPDVVPNSFEFVESRFEANEGLDSVRIAVRRIGDTSRYASVRYRTRDVTAFAGWDYLAEAGTLSFAPLETEQSFTVRLLNKAAADPNRTLVLELSQAVGVDLIGRPTAELHLPDAPQPGLVRLDPTFQPALASVSWPETDHGFLRAAPDGRALIVAASSRKAGQGGGLKLVQLTPDGRADSTFQPQAATNAIFDPLPDGRVIGWSDGRLFRLLPSGELDPAFAPIFPEARSGSLAGPTPEGGAFMTFEECPGGCPSTTDLRHRLIRVQANGSVDSGFNAGLFSTRPQAWVLRDGTVMVAAADLGIARLRQNGERANGLLPPAPGGRVPLFLEQADGRIIFVSEVASAFPVAVVRLFPDGRRDEEFRFSDNPGAWDGWSPTITALAEQPDGKLIAGVVLVHSLGGGPWCKLVRLNQDGTLDPSFYFPLGFYFSPPSERQATIQDLSLLPNGQILVAGQFTGLGGQPFPGLVRINGDDLTTLTSVSSLPGQAPRITGLRPPGRVRVLEASSDLQHWLPVSTNGAAGIMLDFTDPGATGTDLRFYRARNP